MDPSLTVSIAGVGVIPLRQISDGRGAVLHMLRNDASDFQGFGECYFSEVLPRAVKAWKLHTRQVQNLVVPVGRIQLVIFDDRPDSITRHALEVLELGRPDSYYRVRIPPGLWYGFRALGESSALIANCADQPHDPAECERREENDPRIPFFWSS